jgi:hypothetical protein
LNRRRRQKQAVTFNRKDGIDAHEHLKELVNKVMIRNTRSDTGLTWSVIMENALAGFSVPFFSATMSS